jgi:photosystem II stability/assembly factor-like uncharacterized protein
LTRRTIFSALAAAGIAKADEAAQYPRWKAIGPWGGSARAVRLDAQSPNRMLAIPMLGAGAFLSNDAGATWREASNFPRLGEVRMDAAWITHVPGALYLIGAARVADATGGLWRSEDHGESWRVVPGTEKLSVYAITSWARDGRVIAIGTNEGVWISNDGATTFRRISPKTIGDLAAIVSVAIDPTKAGVIYAGTPHLPWKTTDGGLTWKKISVGMFDDSDIFSIHVNPLQPSKVFASACSGIYGSLDGGVAWKRMQGIPGTNRRTYVVVQSPHEAGVLFAGTSAGMWTSRNGGAAWSKLNDYVATSVTFHPAAEKLIYISTERHGLLKSVDRGASFQRMHTGFASLPISGVEPDGAGVRLRSAYVQGALRSRDWKDWEVVESGEEVVQDWRVRLPADAMGHSVDPFEPSMVLAATRGGLLRSDDGGGTWKLVESGLGKEWVGSVAHHPKRRGYVFTLRGQRVFWSRDHGMSWYWLRADERQDLGFERLAMVAGNPNLLLAVSRNRGLYAYSLHENPLD